MSRLGDASVERGSVIAFIASTAVVVLGIIFLVTGIQQANRAEVRCGGATMSPGDRCSTIGGDGGVRDIDEQQEENREGGMFGMGLGLVTIAIGGVYIVLNIRARIQ